VRCKSASVPRIFKGGCSSNSRICGAIVHEVEAQPTDQSFSSCKPGSRRMSFEYHADCTSPRLAIIGSSAPGRSGESECSSARRPVWSTFDRSGGEIVGLMKRTFFGRGTGDTFTVLIYEETCSTATSSEILSLLGDFRLRVRRARFCGAFGDWSYSRGLERSVVVRCLGGLGVCRTRRGPPLGRFLGWCSFG
jgi:hypothetical protein